MEKERRGGGGGTELERERQRGKHRCLDSHTQQHDLSGYPPPPLHPQSLSAETATLFCVAGCLHAHSRSLGLLCFSPFTIFQQTKTARPLRPNFQSFAYCFTAQKSPRTLKLLTKINTNAACVEVVGGWGGGSEGHAAVSRIKSWHARFRRSP